MQYALQVSNTHAIADLKLPAGAEAAPIADTRPELTAALRKALEAAADGKTDPAAYSEAGQRGAVPFYQDFGQAMLLAVGAIKDVALMDERAASNGELRRRYQVTFERRSIAFVVHTDAAGLLSEIRPLSGDDL